MSSQEILPAKTGISRSALWRNLLFSGNLRHIGHRKEVISSWLIMTNSTFHSSQSPRGILRITLDLSRKKTDVTMMLSTRCWWFWRTRILLCVYLLVRGYKTPSKTTRESLIRYLKNSWATARCSEASQASSFMRKSTTQTTWKKILQSSETLFWQHRRSS